jgi:hypothetical protein
MTEPTPATTKEKTAKRTAFPFGLPNYDMPTMEMSEAFRDYNLKLIEMGRANTNSALEFICGLIAMKSHSQMVELSTEQVRKQIELITEQSKGIWALAELLRPKLLSR